MLEQFDGELAQDMEADDLIGIICTRDPEDTIAVVVTKALLSPPTWFNHMKDVTVQTTPEEAKYNRLVRPNDDLLTDTLVLKCRRQDS